MPSSTRKSRSRVTVVAATACSAVLLTGAASSSAASERVTCPPGYEFGALTVTQARQLPRFVAAFENPEDSGFTEEGFVAAFGPGGFFDRNDNGLLCYKEARGLENVSPYVYLIIDDPGGNPPAHPE
jgi:hypothetical protein